MGGAAVRRPHPVVPMRRSPLFLVPVLTAVLLAAPLQAAAAENAGAEQPALVLGVFPYVSASQLVRFHAPLRDHIAQTLNRPVTLVTAPDFASFIERTRAGAYDIVLTAPHFGRLAERRDGYRRLVRTQNEIFGVFLVPSDSPVRRIEQLRGRRVIMAQRLAVIFQMAELELREKGLVPGHTVSLIETSTHNNAMSAPLRGDAEAAVVPGILWQTLAAESRQPMREIARTRSVPGVMLMANPRLPEQEVAALRAGLLGYAATEAGQGYFAATGMRGFAAITDQHMNGLDPYLAAIATLP